MGDNRRCPLTVGFRVEERFLSHGGDRLADQQRRCHFRHRWKCLCHGDSLRRWSTEAAGIVAVEEVAEILNESLVPRSAPPGVPFVDVGTSDWFYETVRWAYQEGVVHGTSPTTFSPFDGVTRGQVAAVLTRFLDLPPATGDPGFTDISDSVFADDIAALVEAGITRGCNPPDNDRFCPERTLTRGEMAAMLVRALQLEHQGKGDRFTDDDTSVFEEDLETLADHDLLLGCNPPQNDRACPGSSLIRAEIVTILERVPMEST